MTQRLAAALGHHLDRQAAVEIGCVGFPLLEIGLFTRNQGVDESIVLLLRQRTIDVVGAGAARAEFVVARLKPGHRHVDRIPVHDRGDRIEERQRVFIGEFADGLGKRRRGEGTGRDDHIAPVRGRQPCDFTALDFDSGMIVQRLGDGGGKPVAIDGESAAGRYLIGVGRAHDQRPKPPHLGMQQPDGIIGSVIGAERIGADEFGERIGAMRLGHPGGAHFVQNYVHASISELPGRLRAGEACADDMDRVGNCLDACHGETGSAFSAAVECAEAKNDSARTRRALSARHWADGRSAVVVPGCNARNVRAIEADIGQLAIAELGQFADIALIVPECLDHADEREQHGSLLAGSIQPLEEASSLK